MLDSVLVNLRMKVLCIEIDIQVLCNPEIEMNKLDNVTITIFSFYVNNISLF